MKSLQLLKPLAAAVLLLPATIWAQDRSKAYGYEFSEVQLRDSFPQLSSAPTLYLNVHQTQPDGTWSETRMESLSTIFGTKNDWYYHCQIVIRDDNGTIKERNEQVNMRGRGNATWDVQGYKKPMRLKFPAKTALLGEEFADEKNWTLLSNYYDASLIRNAMSYELGKYVGLEFCPAYKFVDVVVNGTYIGSYQISDHVQVAKKRVPITENVGYFLEANSGKRSGFLEDPYIEVELGNSSTKMYVNVKSPDPDVNTENGPSSDPKFSALKAHLNKIGGLVNNGPYNTTETWRNYVDLNSAVNAFIAMEVTGNYDGNVANDYFYMQDLESKIKFGPLWDFDLAWGSRCNGIDMSQKHFWESEEKPFGSLCKKLLNNDPYFVKALYERWTELKNGGIESFLLGRVAALKVEVAPSAALNYALVNNGGAGASLNKGWADANSYSNLDETYTTMTQFISKHLLWLEGEFSSRYINMGCKDLTEPGEEKLNGEGFAIKDYDTPTSNNLYAIPAADIHPGATEIEVSVSRQYQGIFLKYSTKGATDEYDGSVVTLSGWKDQLYSLNYIINDAAQVGAAKENGLNLFTNASNVRITCRGSEIHAPSCETHIYTDKYIAQEDGTYRLACDVCGNKDEDHIYHLLKVYEESSTAKTVYATNWTLPEGTNYVATSATATGTNIINSGTCQNFVVTDGRPIYIPSKFTAATATYTRALVNDWGTICIPFKVQEVNADDANFYQLQSATDKEFVFELATSTGAYTPMAFKRKSGAETLTVTAIDVTVKASSSDKTKSTCEGWNMIGTVEPLVFDNVQTEASLSGRNLYYISGGMVWKATGSFTCNPYRAYLTSEFQLPSSGARMRIDGVEEGIEQVCEEPAASTVVSRLLLPLPAGQYQINGKNINIK